MTKFRCMTDSKFQVAAFMTPLALCVQRTMHTTMGDHAFDSSRGCTRMEQSTANRYTSAIAADLHIDTET